jgi:hypothetical protein
LCLLRIKGSPNPIPLPPLPSVSSSCRRPPPAPSPSPSPRLSLLRSAVCGPWQQTSSLLRSSGRPHLSSPAPTGAPLSSSPPSSPLRSARLCSLSFTLSGSAQIHRAGRFRRRVGYSLGLLRPRAARCRAVSRRAARSHHHFHSPKKPNATRGCEHGGGRHPAPPPSALPAAARFHPVRRAAAPRSSAPSLRGTHPPPTPPHPRSDLIPPPSLVFIFLRFVLFAPARAAAAAAG